MSSKKSDDCKKHEAKARKVLEKTTKDAADSDPAELKSVIDTEVKKHLKNTGNKSRSGVYQGGLDLHSFYTGLRRKKPSMPLPFYINKNTDQLRGAPIAYADVVGGLTFTEEMKAKEEALLKEIYDAAGVAMEIEESAWTPYIEKLAWAKSRLDELGKTESLPDKSKSSKGKYGIKFAMKHLKKIYPKAKVRKSYMAGSDWKVTKTRLGVLKYRDRWGILLYSLPDEDICRKAQFSMRELANGRKFKKTKDVLIDGEWFVNCP